MFSYKNLTLFLVLIAIGTFTYFHEEVGKNQQVNIQRLKKMAINIDFPTLASINLPNAKIYQKDGVFFGEELDYPVDSEVLNKFVEQLSKIEIAKDITHEITENLMEEIFQNDALKFSYIDKNGKVEVKLGSMVPLTGNFYLEKSVDGKKIYYICQDHTILEDSYNKDEEMKKRYLALQSRLDSVEFFFLAKNPLRNFNYQSLKTVSISNKWNRPFEINYQKNETSPPLIPGLIYHQQSFVDFKNKFKDLFYIEIFKLIDAAINLDDKVSDVKLKIGNEEVVHLSLYKRYKDQQGYFLTIDNQKFVYSIPGASSQLFFLNVQDFWNKTPLMSGDIGKDDLPFKIIFDNGPAYDLVVPRGPQFDVVFQKDSDHNPFIDRENFRKLFHILFAINDFEQAFRVSKFSPVLNNIEGFKINLDERNFKIIRKADELLLIDTDRGYVLHYLVDKRDFIINHESFFK